jgi:hypothetical protein
MVDKYKHKKTLIIGKAGELTMYANPLTFSLLEKIFGFRGPYRETLKRFSVFPIETKASFLRSVNGRVYTNIDEENEIVWKNYPSKLYLDNTYVKQTAFWFPNFFTKLKNFTQKVIKESQIVNNPSSVEKIADNHYLEFCIKTRRVCGYSNLNSSQFLEYYKEVIFINYLYELFESYNLGVKIDLQKYDTYFKLYDYLFNSSNLLENRLKLPNGFYLDQYDNLDDSLDFVIGDNKFIPDRLPDVETPITKIGLETKLHCMKDNMRLETNILLYFLNKTLLEKAKIRGIQDIGFYTLDELEKEDNNLEDLSETIKKRKREFDLDKAQKLGQIIFSDE